jgi:starch synthase
MEAPPRSAAIRSATARKCQLQTFAIARTNDAGPTQPDAQEAGVNILLATSELSGLTRGGPLADFCRALSRELAGAGHRVAVILPAYREVLARRPNIQDTGVPLGIPIGNRTVTGKVLRAAPLERRVEVYLVAQDQYFDRAGLYQHNGQDYVDNCERFVFFCRGVMETVPHLGWAPDVLHANDWQTGLLPAYLLAEYRGVPGYEQIASVFTIHNAAFQGQFWHWDMMLTGLDWKYFNWQQMEFYGHLNLLKTAAVFADALTTVSPAYAREIQAPPALLEINETGLTRPIELPGGCGLEGVFYSRRDALTGLLSGTDDDPRWDPRTDTALTSNFGPATPAGKAPNKTALKEELGLPATDLPLVAVAGPLNDQHGMDLVMAVLQTWLPQHDAQWVICGPPSQPYRAPLAELARRFAGKLAVRLDPDDDLPHRVLAGADAVVSASRFGPGNPLHLTALKYGAVPIAFPSGIMADVVIDATADNLATGTANGFLFGKYSTSGLHTALARATAVYRSPKEWAAVRDAALKLSISWRDAAQGYLDVYQRAGKRLKLKAPA